MDKLLSYFPELLPLFPEKTGIGARTIEIREVLQNREIPTNGILILHRVDFW